MTTQIVIYIVHVIVFFLAFFPFFIVLYKLIPHLPLIVHLGPLKYTEQNSYFYELAIKNKLEILYP